MPETTATILVRVRARARVRVKVRVKVRVGVRVRVRVRSNPNLRDGGWSARILQVGEAVRRRVRSSRVRRHALLRTHAYGARRDAGRGGARLLGWG